MPSDLALRRMHTPKWAKGRRGKGGWEAPSCVVCRVVGSGDAPCFVSLVQRSTVLAHAIDRAESSQDGEDETSAKDAAGIPCDAYLDQLVVTASNRCKAFHPIRFCLLFSFFFKLNSFQ